MVFRYDLRPVAAYATGVNAEAHTLVTIVLPNSQRALLLTAYLRESICPSPTEETTGNTDDGGSIVGRLVS